MSIATSCPELFTNLIGTFITESDIGIGTIVGSSLFNALGVASIGGLAAVRVSLLILGPVEDLLCNRMISGHSTGLVAGYARCFDLHRSC